MPEHNKGKKNRKYGRNDKKCEAYRAKNQREANKARRQATLRRHIDRHKSDREPASQGG